MYELKTTYPLTDGFGYPGSILIVGGRRDVVAGPVEAYGELPARVRAARQTHIVMVEGDHGKSPANLDEAIRSSAYFLSSLFATK